MLRDGRWAVELVRKEWYCAFNEDLHLQPPNEKQRGDRQQASRGTSTSLQLGKCAITYVKRPFWTGSF